MPTIPQKRRAKKKAESERERIYSKVTIELCGEDNPLTVEGARQLLGWEEEAGQKFGDDYLLKEWNAKLSRFAWIIAHKAVF